MAQRWLHVIWILAVGVPCASVWADEYFLTIGGGYSPSSNQVSLEKNVLYFRRVLDATGHAAAHRHELFADGSDPAPDVQYSAGDLPEHRLGYLLAAIFGETDDVYNAYRSNELSELDGPATPDEIDRYFDQTACKLGAQDRLLIYYTGHGGRGQPESATNTTIELWRDQKMRMQEFAARLEKVPPHVPVVLVMVQCYSGGFANVIFREGDPAKGLTEHSRAGFFATVHDRTAAGCTPDVHEADYQEYSSHFFAALCGSDRLGQPVQRPDYDGDGRTTFDEAHAYALLVSDSIDVSIKTSDVLLRHYSRTGPTDSGARADLELMTAEVHYPALTARASASEKAVLEGLSSQLQLTDYMRTREAKARADQLQESRTELGQEAEKLRKEYKAARRSIRQSLESRWPELRNPWHPRVALIVTRQRPALRRAIESHEKFGRFSELAQRIHALEEQRLELERQWAKCQRLIRTAENIALAANLPKVAPPEVCRRYEALVAAENATLE